MRTAGRGKPVVSKAARLAVATALVLWALPAGGAAAQSFRRAGTEFNSKRTVQVPPDKDYSVVQVEFFHHGQIDAEGTNVLVFTRSRQAVPRRILQLGPGDRCRLAFQTVPREKVYEIFYGGQPPDEGGVPEWTSRDGLLLETRRYKDCNLNRYESVRDAFLSAQPIGAGYVPHVRHSYNPFSLVDEPFLSRYTGTLWIPAPGKYGFFTSSQDASFLLIDGRVVVAAPGRHGPLRRATPGSRRDVQLAAGPHRFEYYHAAAGPRATMVAAWEENPQGKRPRPSAIPSQYFHADKVGYLRPGPVSMRSGGSVPDFLVNLAGDVPLPDSRWPLVGVKFIDFSPPALTLKARLRWDFGDGQTSRDPNPFHVYLRPGLYTVTLSVRRGARDATITNRVEVGRPRIFKQAQTHTLDQYLPVLETYDPKTLDAESLRQLVLAYQFKAQQLIAQIGESNQSASTDRTESPRETQPAADSVEERKAEAARYLAAAVAAAQGAFLDESAAQGDRPLMALARLVGPLARCEVGDSLLAGRIWHGAAARINDPQLKAECEIAAADIAVNDLGNEKTALTFLEAAASHLPDQQGPLASRLKRVWGDYYAMTGDGQRARKAYLEAEAAQGSRRRYAEGIAWQGAHARSTEQFIKSGELDRAARQLHAWQDEFPTDKIEGYLTLLYARYWARRQVPERAIAMAEQLLTVNPDSPYADQILWLAAECEIQRGQPDRALATLHALLTDYPGSPLVPEAKKKMAAIEAREG
ncbi:MAG TPA: PKD domain-containing protein [Planctomycetes bacterium]|nr:PKD domain-containing protein [Planctomycetota bacterium]